MGILLKTLLYLSRLIVYVYNSLTFNLSFDSMSIQMASALPCASKGKNLEIRQSTA